MPSLPLRDARLRVFASTLLEGAEATREITGMPAHVSKKYDKIVSRVKRTGGAVNPYAVARAQINRMYTKTGKRKQAEVSKGLRKWRARQKPGAIMAPSTFARVKRGAAQRPGVRDPGAVAGAAYWRTARAKYRQRRKASELYMAEERKRLRTAQREKEANAATSMGQLFRKGAVPPEWAAWRAIRMRRAHAAQGLFERAMMPFHQCGEGCPLHGKEKKAA